MRKEGKAKTVLAVIGTIGAYAVIKQIVNPPAEMQVKTSLLIIGTVMCLVAFAGEVYLSLKHKSSR